MRSSPTVSRQSSRSPSSFLQLLSRCRDHRRLWFKQSVSFGSQNAHRMVIRKLGYAFRAVQCSSRIHSSGNSCSLPPKNNETPPPRLAEALFACLPPQAIRLGERERTARVAGGTSASTQRQFLADAARVAPGLLLVSSLCSRRRRSALDSENRASLPDTRNPFLQPGIEFVRCATACEWLHSLLTQAIWSPSREIPTLTLRLLQSGCFVMLSRADLREERMQPSSRREHTVLHGMHLYPVAAKCIQASLLMRTLNAATTAPLSACLLTKQ